MKSIKHVVMMTVLVGLLGLILAMPCTAGWLDQVLGGGNSTSNAATAATSLTVDEMTKGLKEALAKGTEKAITNLGQTNGFLNNLNVKIPMPEKLQQIEKGLRAMKQDKYADEFVATMNHAAEAAMPQAAPIVGDAIQQMTVDDAKNILNGPDDAATQYFRKVGEARLKEKMLPIVKTATAKAGVTAAYKNLIGKAGFMASFAQKENLDVDQYVTGKAVDGLFLMIAAEEKEIRKNPMARSSDLLKKVFGSVTSASK